MASLYDIDKRLLEYRGEFDEETGEWLNESELDDLKMERNEKIEQLLLWSKNIDAEAEMVKNERDNLDERYKRLKNKSSRIKDHVARELNGERFTTPRVETLWRKSERVIIPDDYKVPDKYCNLTVVRKPDRTRIKQLLKNSDEKVDWATIETNNNMSIR